MHSIAVCIERKKAFSSSWQRSSAESSASAIHGNEFVVRPADPTFALAAGAYSAKAAAGSPAAEHATTAAATYTPCRAASAAGAAGEAQGALGPRPGLPAGFWEPCGAEADLGADPLPGCGAAGGRGLRG